MALASPLLSPLFVAALPARTAEVPALNEASSSAAKPSRSELQKQWQKLAGIKPAGFFDTCNHANFFVILLWHERCPGMAGRL